MKRLFCLLALYGIVIYGMQEDLPPLLRDLERAEELNKKIEDRLPFFYNNSLLGGYFNMPSARMNRVGDLAFGSAYVPPYWFFGLNLQVYDRVELSGTYRVYRGILEPVIGKEGFGDDADRGANIKLQLLSKEDGFRFLPEIAIGADDVIGTRRFNSQYIVATKEIYPLSLELTLGWAKGRIKGWFGGIGWTPLRDTDIPLLNRLSFLGEFDAINYRYHHFEHPKGRHVKHRINAGVSFQPSKYIEAKAGILRGQEFEGALLLRYPLGTTKGFLPKVDDPCPYRSPVDVEPLGIRRDEMDLAQEFAFAFRTQGLNLFTLYLTSDEEHHPALWMKVVNVCYREEKEVWKRIQSLLSALTPSNIARVTVVIDADGLPSHQYVFRGIDLKRMREGALGFHEARALSPMKEVAPLPCPFNRKRLFSRKKPVWVFTIRPRLLTFFGSASGKFKYALGIIAGPEGYFFDEVFYRLWVSYDIKSSIESMKDQDRLNPSQLLNVRTDSIRYFQTNSVSLEQAFLQKSFNCKRGTFFRVATGLFEPAYGGVAFEALYYPVGSSWAIGIEEATLLKRHYHGVKFFHHIRKLKGTTPEFVPFTGVQYFLDLYYQFKVFPLDVKLMIGQFLAKDKGIRAEVTRQFDNGVRFSIWYTLTNGHDKVGSDTNYHDKGISFCIPFDFFLKKSSRTMINYAMSAWLRDVGAIARTGKPLYTILREERR